ncbi:hypothetical protein [Neobacillus sp. PS2-9]|uniref:hypothetical protein n=1 Tax=Neobacillus sp. PS2-9 TaxID=3070676 RepID=UPI0027E0E117|nr:hypothetical protein [Neobacillus sp. PS2-9]WML57101.1 hypothetical protein RCG25_19540 [Neobacillus sp. PS2-9]
MKQKGVEKGNHVVLLLENSLSLSRLFMHVEESTKISYIFKNARVDTVILIPELKPMTDEIKLEMPQVLHVMTTEY